MGRARACSVAVMVVWSLVAAGGVEAGTGEPLGVGPPRGAQLVGPQFRVSGALAVSNDSYAEVVYNSTDREYLVVWVDARNLGTQGYEIYGQRIGPAGQRIGGNKLISGPAAVVDVEGPPGVAYNSTTNQYLVVWEDGRNLSTSGWDVYGQRVGAAGNRVGSNFRVSGAAALGNDLGPVVAHNSTTNQYLVAWQDGRNMSGRGTDAFGQRVSAAGSRVGANFRISGPAAIENDGFVSLAYNPTANQYLVVWRDGRDTGPGGSHIYGQRVGAAGSRVGGNVRITGAAATGAVFSPSVAYNPTGDQYLVVWRDDRNVGTRSFDIYGQRVDAAGSRVGGNLRISGALALSSETTPAVAYNPTDNRFLVVWKDERDAETRGSEIYGQRVTATGARVGGNLRISRAGAIENEREPAVACNPITDQYLVVWEDGRNAGTSGVDVYGQRVAG